jgi:hypothetical protein
MQPSIATKNYVTRFWAIVMHLTSFEDNWRIRAVQTNEYQ